MNKLAMFAVAAFAFAFTACAVESPDSPESIDETQETLPGGDEALDPRGEAPPELQLVPPPRTGCAANFVCSGAKTCGAWTAFSDCGTPYSVSCDTSCEPSPFSAPGEISISGRTGPGCPYTGTYAGENRTRTCVIRATGASCVEYTYREHRASCRPTGT